MTRPDPHGLRGLVPLTLVSLVVVVVALGLSRGVWITNLHNGLLALALTSVASYVLFQRPGHREGLLLMAAGAVEGMLFYGRQVGHSALGDGSAASTWDRWWGWLGVWPLVVSLALTTFAVICFPDGRLPSARWRPVAALVIAVTVGCAAISAIWPVDYAAVGVVTIHPLNIASPSAVTTLWAAVAHPAYAAFQVLWVVALLARWRSADGAVRRQVASLAGAAAVSVALLLGGLVIWGTPVPGLISATLLPLTAGWAIVHGQHTAAYSALSWLSRIGPGSADLPTDIAHAVAQALSATGATLWMGSPGSLHAVGVWPETGAAVRPTDADALRAGDRHVHVVSRRDVAVGALSVERPRANRLSLAEDRLFADLAAQAALVIDHLDLSELISRQRRAGHLHGLTPRERAVLDLMARGLSNAAICEELHLSVKTVEPVVSAIFTKLGLHPDATANRRVLAVLAYVRA